MPDYKGLASLMDEYHDVTIFRRFRKLNLQNLLHMQAELVHVEQELQEIHDEDSRSDDPIRQSFQTNWKVMEDSFRSGGENLQRTKRLDARDKLAKYNSSLLTQAQLNSLSSPQKQSLDILRDWLRRPGYGNSFLQGFERRTWEDVEPADMVVLQKEAEDHNDPLTRWLLRVIPGFFHDRWGHRWKVAVRDQEKGDQELFVYKDSNFAKFTTAVTTFLSTVFPVVSIFVLYYVKAMVVRPPGRDLHGYLRSHNAIHKWARPNAHTIKSRNRGYVIAEPVSGGREERFRKQWFGIMRQVSKSTSSRKQNDLLHLPGCLDVEMVGVRPNASRQQEKLKAIQQKREAARIREQKEQGLCTVCGTAAPTARTDRCEVRERKSLFRDGMDMAGETRDPDEPKPSVQSPVGRRRRGVDTRHRDRKAQGICTKCGKKLAMGGTLICETCEDKRKAYRRKPATKKRTTMRNKARYAEALSKGLCGMCQRAPRRPGMASCEPCGNRPRSGKSKRRARDPSPDDYDEDDSENDDETMLDEHDDSEEGEWAGLSAENQGSDVETESDEEEEIEDEIIVRGYENDYETADGSEDESEDASEDASEDESEDDITVMDYEAIDEKGIEPSSPPDGESQDPDEPMPDEHGTDREDQVEPVEPVAEAHAEAHESDGEQQNPVVDHERDNRMDIDFLLG
ncbi:hypothetical protein PG991_003014 [Apiospora marii]|uniref:DUF6594 domain-containing protein n=1 Tax=Apiospora marii TaxID=335849 RepID=A0ABR1SH35_9PEZI